MAETEMGKGTTDIRTAFEYMARIPPELHEAVVEVIQNAHETSSQSQKAAFKLAGSMLVKQNERGKPDENSSDERDA